MLVSQMLLELFLSTLQWNDAIRLMLLEMFLIEYSQMKRVGGDEDIYICVFYPCICTLSIAKKMHLEYVFNNLYPKFM